jgi:hypothetical protein
MAQSEITGVRDEVAGATGHPHTCEFLQQARGAETSDWISYRHGFPPEDPASHRKPQRRVAQMNDFHLLTSEKMRHST